MIKHGIILAGGEGKRLAPLTNSINKHLLPVSNRFIIDYPIATLKQLGVENCTVVLGGNHFSQVVDHLQDGQKHEMNFNYVYQGSAKGISHGINLAKSYVGDKEFVVCLGDNLFEHEVLFSPNIDGAQIIVKQILDPKRFGVIFCNGLADIKMIEEKPQIIDPIWQCWVITGCYLFDQRYFDYFKELKPSARNEFEIVDIIKHYHQDGLLKANPYYSFWSDAGIHESIAHCNNYFYSKQKQACLH